jgi:hypothetical protein
MELIFAVDTHDDVPKTFGFGLFDVGRIGQELVILTYGAYDLFRAGKGCRHRNLLRLNRFFSLRTAKPRPVHICAARQSFDPLIRWLRRPHSTRTAESVKQRFS